MHSRRSALKNIGLVAGLASFPISNLFAANEKPLDLQPILIQPGEGDKTFNESTTYTRKIRKEHTGGAFSSIETTLKDGYLGAPPHLHQQLDEMMYVLDGTVTVMVGTEVVEVKAGGWHFRPRKLIHCFWNTSGKKAHFIDMFLPGGFEEYLYELCNLYQKFGKIEPAEVGKFAHKYDIEVHFELIEPIVKKYGLKL